MNDFYEEERSAKVGVRQKALISLALRRGLRADGAYLKRYCYVTDRDVLNLYPELGTNKKKALAKLLILQEYGIFERANPQQPVFMLTTYGASIEYADEFLVEKYHSSGHSADNECHAIPSSMDGSCPVSPDDEGGKKKAQI